MEGYIWLKLDTPMKNLLLPFLLCISATLFAQNWMPVVPGDVYHFRALDSSYVTHTIRVDSVKKVGEDSVFYLNRVIETTNIDPNVFIFENSLGQFLGETMTKKPNGSLMLLYHRSSSSLEIEIRPLAAVNDTWIAVPDSNVTATILSIQAGMVLGEPDSLKTILFSNGATWILSKNHGVIQALDPFFSSQRPMLVGIETRSLGEQPLYFDNFFGFNVGDIFEWYEYHEGFGIGNFSTSKCLILEKELQPDYYAFLVDRKQKYSFGGGPLPSGIAYKADTLWIRFYRDLYPLADAYNHENVYLWLADRSSYATSFEQGKKIGSKPYASGQPVQCPVLPAGNNLNEYYYAGESNACCNIATFECEEGQYYEEYRIGLGRVGFIERYIDGYNHEQLLGAVIQGDTVWGAISPDWFFTSTHAPTQPQPLLVMPNPAEDFIYLNMANPEGEFVVKITDLSGKTFVQQTLNIAPGTRLDISVLPSGAFLVQVIDTQQMWAGKFQKVH